MFFIVLVAVIALTIAGAAAYFSVYGLALIFSGALVPVIIMASALEIGKLCATTVVHNYWKELGFMMRSYLIGAILVLMLITSGGIYGFLSAAYQTDKMPLEQVEARIVLLEQEYERKTARLKQMDDTIASIGANYISKRLEEKKQQEAERLQLSDRINAIESEKLELSKQKLETEAHIGPIIYMAEAFGKTPDQAAHYLILLFIFVFDPLAVALTVCVSILVQARIRRKEEEAELDEETEAHIGIDGRVWPDEVPNPVDHEEFRTPPASEPEDEDVKKSEVPAQQDDQVVGRTIKIEQPTDYTEYMIPLPLTVDRPSTLVQQEYDEEKFDKRWKEIDSKYAEKHAEFLQQVAEAQSNQPVPSEYNVDEDIQDLRSKQSEMADELRQRKMDRLDERRSILQKVRNNQLS